MADKNATGKKVSQEQSIPSKLKDMIKTDSKVYFVLWKYAPHLLSKKNIRTFAELKSNYTCCTEGMDEASSNNWLSEQNVQTAVKWLLKRLHQEKLITLYNLYFDKAKEDTNAFKAFIDFSSKFFEEDKDSELLTILNNIPDNELS